MRRKLVTHGNYYTRFMLTSIIFLLSVMCVLLINVQHQISVLREDNQRMTGLLNYIRKHIDESATKDAEKELNLHLLNNHLGEKTLNLLRALMK